MPKTAKTVVEVVELGGSKVLLVEVLTTEQLEWIYPVYSPPVYPNQGLRQEGLR